MKQFIKKWCYICIFTLFAINSTVLIYAKTFNDKPYVVLASYQTQCMIKDDKNILNQNQKDFIKKVFDENFHKIWEKYGYQEKPPIITFIIDSKFVPETASGAELGNGQIAFKENAFSNISEYSKDLIIHELAHTVQEYHNATAFHWLTEGLADYIASEYSTHKLSLIPKQYTKGELYDGYLTTAGFLKWLDKKYSGSVMKIHHIMQQGKMEYQTFESITGKTLDDLWKEYSGKTLLSKEKYYLNIIENTKYSEYKRQEAMAKLGDYYYYECKDPQAITWYEKAKNFGGVKLALGYIYLEGEIVPKDVQKAYNYYLDIAKNENLPEKLIQQSYVKIGDIYYYEYKDPQAITWYEKAENYGGVKLMLGDIYLKGEIVPKDVQKAYNYYLDIAKNENLPEKLIQRSYAKIGDIYYYEYKDPQAITWYEKAENYGNGGVKLVLGNIYMEGKIVPQDISKARSYFLDIIQNPYALEKYKKYASDNLKSISDKS